MKTLKVMSRWYFGTDVIHISHSFVQSQYGCKSWVLVSATGVPYKIKIYQGRKNQGSDEPLSTRFVKNAFQICKKPKDNNVYFGNFFSSY